MTAIRRYTLFSILILSFFLNFYKLDQIPPGLYMDEASIGVNAYSILKTGFDEHGKRLPIYFEAFGEYKLPVYIYLTSFSMLLFGKNEFAVRFPSAFLGSISPLIFYFLISEIFKKDKLSLLSSLLLATSPWFLHFTGPAFEATVGLFLLISAGLLFMLYIRKTKLIYLILSLAFSFLTVYTYQSYRMITPILVFIILFLGIKNRKIPLSHLFLILIFFIPMITSSLSKELNIRFFQTSAFSGNKWTTPLVFLGNFLSFFSFDFLFNRGDGIGRHQMLNLGLLFKWQLPLLLGGFYYLFKTIKLFSSKIIILFLFLVPIPAALTLPSPHSLRSLPMVLPYIILVSLAINYAYRKFKINSLVFILIITVIFTFESSYYLHQYFFHYPKTSLMDWGANYKELVSQTIKYKNKYQIMALADNLPQAYIYFRFYDNSLSPISINLYWNKTGYEVNQPILLITKYIDEKSNKPSNKLLETIYLTNDNKDGFAQFWEI